MAEEARQGIERMFARAHTAALLKEHVGADAPRASRSGHLVLAKKRLERLVRDVGEET